VAAVLGMGALTYGLIEGGAQGWRAPLVMGALILAVVALVTFLVAQARGEHPMVPLELFRSRPVAVRYPSASRSPSASRAWCSCSACTSSKCGGSRHSRREWRLYR